MFVCFSNCGVLFSYLWEFRCSEKAWTCLFVCSFVSACGAPWILCTVTAVTSTSQSPSWATVATTLCRPSLNRPEEARASWWSTRVASSRSSDLTPRGKSRWAAPGFLAPWLPFTESITNDERWVTNDVPWGTNDERTITNGERWVTNDELWGAHDERMVNDEWRMTSYEGRMMNE